jgi:hypothetical protein
VRRHEDPVKVVAWYREQQDFWTRSVDVPQPRLLRAFSRMMAKWAAGGVTYHERQVPDPGGALEVRPEVRTNPETPEPLR